MARVNMFEGLVRHVYRGEEGEREPGNGGIGSERGSSPSDATRTSEPRPRRHACSFGRQIPPSDLRAHHSPLSGELSTPAQSAPKYWPTPFLSPNLCVPLSARREASPARRMPLPVHATFCGPAPLGSTPVEHRGPRQEQQVRRDAVWCEHWPREMGNGTRIQARRSRQPRRSERGAEDERRARRSEGTAIRGEYLTRESIDRVGQRPGDAGRCATIDRRGSFVRSVRPRRPAARATASGSTTCFARTRMSTARGSTSMPCASACPGWTRRRRPVSVRSVLTLRPPSP